jgi:ribose-phosphate pyrophosphokinase
MLLINGENLDLTHFPDGSLLMKLAAYGESLEIQWLYENDSELFAIICATKHLRRINSDISISLILPYIPHSRMDRVYNDCDVFTLKYFADTINSLGFTKVTVLDPHSDVSMALIDNIHVLSPLQYIEQALQSIQNIEGESPIFYYPDSNAAKKYGKIIAKPFCYGNKKRNWENGEILGLDIIDNSINIANHNILMIDDIISYGGSMYYSALTLKDLGAKNIYAFASHVENSILKGKLIQSNLIKKVYTTNSLFKGNHELIHVINI